LTMHIIEPDPHPGRCENYRSVVHSDGYVETLRCLDYEGTEHICSFPEPEHRVITVGGYTYTPQAPQRWIKPDE
jgi:hypothetical protein